MGTKGGAGTTGGAFPVAMPLESLDLPPAALGLLGGMCDGLNEMQADSVRAGILEGQSVLVSAPTSGGKTLVAILAMLSCLSRGAGRAVYLCPMRSLAAEKHRELLELETVRFNGKRPRVAKTTGERETGGRGSGEADVIVMTNERLDALMRKDGRWRERIGLLVVDEVHMVGDGKRGPALEAVIAHAMSMDRPPQIVGLSATAPNAQELARWLGANLVQSYTRPVPLLEGVYDGETLRMSDGDTLPVERGGGYGAAVHVGLASALAGHKALLFADTKRGAALMARDAAKAIGGRLSRNDRERLRKTAARIMQSAEPTETVRALASAVEGGAAFHHAGLAQECREAVEDGFREGAIRLVASTPTLAMGVNLPARRVVISSLTLFDYDVKRRVPIGVREYRQMAGRAGRPRYDPVGEAIIVTDMPGAVNAWKHYIRGEPERVDSHMAGVSLRAHLLGLVAIRPGITEGGIVDFFLMTLAGIQAGGEEIRRAVGAGLCFLRSGGLVATGGGGPASLVPSGLGDLAAKMYMEPSAALAFQRAARAGTSGAGHELGLLYAAVTHGNAWKISARKADMAPLGELITANTDEIFEEIGGEEDDVGRTMLALWHWKDEEGMSGIADRLGVEQGTMRGMAQEAARAIRHIAAVSRLERNATLAREAEELAVRVEHGVRHELIGLAGLRHVGRAHARRLHGAGYGTPASLLALSAKGLAKIIPVGEKRAAEILEQARGLPAGRG